MMEIASINRDLETLQWRGREPACRMHPPLVLHRNPHCRQEIIALQDCHRDHSLSKFWGACNDAKTKLDACFRKQKDFKRKVNLAKARAEKERLQRKREEHKERQHREHQDR